MQSTEVEIGQVCAMRMKLSADEPLLKVQVVTKTGRKSQVKVRRLTEPFSGLEEWTTTRHLVVPWSERRAFLKDEERKQRFDQGRPAINQGLAGAIQTVMYATGYSDASADDDGTVHMEAPELREMARIAGLPEALEELHPLAYVDRLGEMHLPLEVAEKLAQAYARAQPQAVLMLIEDEENEYRSRGYEPGERFWHDELRRRTPGFALARYWAGHEEEVAALRTEIERLRRLVENAAHALVSAGAEREGLRLRRALQGR